MTNAELIAKLQTLPPDALVLIPGYETGYDHLVVMTGHVTPRERKSFYNGAFDSSDDPAAPLAILLERAASF